MFVSGFVGKTNLFLGVVTGPDSVTVNGVTMPAAHDGLAAGRAVSLSLRPEKIVLSAPSGGVEGKVGAAVFHGSHWLYTLTSPLGDMIAIAPNTGEPPWSAGAGVSLGWPKSALRVLPEGKPPEGMVHG